MVNSDGNKKNFIGIDYLINSKDCFAISSSSLVGITSTFVFAPALLISSAVAFAAVLKEKEQFKGKKIGVIISGGNVDVNNLPFNHKEMLMV